MRKVLALVMLAACLLTLAGCHEDKGEGEENMLPVPNPNGEIERTSAPDEFPEADIVPGFDLDEPDEVVVPFWTTTDIEESFSEGEPDFVEDGDKPVLTTEELENGEYDSSGEAYDLPGEWETMALSCTWTASAKLVYIGFLNDETGEVYELSVDGGSITGRLDLDCLPEGSYKVILYSVKNEKTDAFLTYQFQ